MNTKPFSISHIGRAGCLQDVSWLCRCLPAAKTPPIPLRFAAVAVIFDGLKVQKRLEVTHG